MTAVQKKLQPWSGDAVATGERVHAAVAPTLRDTLVKAYGSVGITDIQEDTFQREERKFRQIATGDFSPSYFQQQGEISRAIASQVDFIDYLKGYAFYGGGLLASLVSAVRWKNKAAREKLVMSLMQSIFSDVTVAMNHFFLEEYARMSAERNAREAAAREEAAHLERAMSQIGSALHRLADGDLRCHIDDPMHEKYETLRSDFNSAVQQLSRTLDSVLGTARSVGEGTREVAASASDLSSRTEQQAAALEEAAAALNEITDTVTSASKTTNDTKQIAMAATDAAETSGKVVAKAEDAMRRIEERSQQISSIIGVIDDIAFQTNLLALNAGVEAARAGEAGKGFAVVAQEVRELAQRSAKAAKEIKTLIQSSNDEVAGGVTLVRDTAATLKAIREHVVQINTQMDDIANASRTQVQGLGEINAAVRGLDQNTQRNAAMVEELLAAAATLDGHSGQLREASSRFRTGHSDEAGGQAVSRAAPPMRRRA